MRNGVPIVYWVYRNIWTGVHLAIVVVVVVLAIGWAQGETAEGMYTEVADWTLNLQHTVASAVPFPWGA